MNKTIYLAGGCFWGVQALLDRVPGVVATEVGYANGTVVNPSYKEVCTGATGAAETVFVTYDEKITLVSLLQVLFDAIDPTTLNKQGPDIGTQYRSGIY
uniref:peptide-methionine (S)-S-oxide reductase MsrA n=1 Tax=Veillonella magna TaxID=464322 RepID=UPI0026662E45